VNFKPPRPVQQTTNTRPQFAIQTDNNKKKITYAGGLGSNFGSLRVVALSEKGVELGDKQLLSALQVVANLWQAMVSDQGEEAGETMEPQKMQSLKLNSLQRSTNSVLYRDAEGELGVGEDRGDVGDNVGLVHSHGQHLALAVHTNDAASRLGELHAKMRTRKQEQKNRTQIIADTCQIVMKSCLVNKDASPITHKHTNTQTHRCDEDGVRADAVHVDAGTRLHVVEVDVAKLGDHVDHIVLERLLSVQA
jgi:hypothetical protein